MVPTWGRRASIWRKALFFLIIYLYCNHSVEAYLFDTEMCRLNGIMRISRDRGGISFNFFGIFLLFRRMRIIFAIRSSGHTPFGAVWWSDLSSSRKVLSVADCLFCTSGADHTSFSCFPEVIVLLLLADNSRPAGHWWELCPFRSDCCSGVISLLSYISFSLFGRCRVY